MSASGTGKGAEREGEWMGALANGAEKEEFEVVSLASVSPCLGGLRIRAAKILTAGSRRLGWTTQGSRVGPRPPGPQFSVSSNVSRKVLH